MCAFLWYDELICHISPLASPSLAIPNLLFQIKITFPLWKTHKESQGSGRSWRDQFKTHSILCLDFGLSFVPVEDSSQMGWNDGRPIWSLLFSSVLSFQIEIRNFNNWFHQNKTFLENTNISLDWRRTKSPAPVPLKVIWFQIHWCTHLKQICPLHF